MPEITLDGFEDVTVGGIRLDVGGPYQFAITEKPELVDMDTDKPYMIMKLKCLSGIEQEEKNNSGTTNPMGLETTERIYLNARFIVKRWLISIGLLARDDQDSPMAKGKFNTDMFYNQKVTAMVKGSMWDGKERRNVEPIIDQ